MEITDLNSCYMHYANIDKPIVPNHSELLDRITYVKVGVPQTSPHFHGQACASILAGKTTGIATSSKLYYFSVPDTPNRPAHYFEAINKIIEINKSLPQNGRMRAVSISDGLEKKDSIWNEWQNTLNKANESGLSVVYVYTLVIEEYLKDTKILGV